jgi:two-component system phosphate regulon sensor histidine kinase PhoR
MFSHPLMALLVESAYEPLILLDGERRVVAANGAARALLPETAIIGSPIDALIANPDLIDLLDCVSMHSECPEAQLVIGGQVFRARCNPIAHDGDRYLALSMQDITQLLRLNRARRDMVANISHELRTPISAIRLLRDTLSRHQASKKDREKMLRKIGRELDTLQRIVDGMHDLSMIESGQAIMKLIEMPLLDLVQEAAEHLDEQLDQREINLRIEVPDDLVVLVDRAQIGRVLGNLIHNATKVTPKKGVIRVSGHMSLNRETVEVNVDDSGPGIPVEERERIFERFYQLDAARTQGRGSGLGLAIARHIIAAHNGQIWVEASDLGGAKFCFTLLAAESRE